MTDFVTIYHNPRCSKSRATLELLNDNGLDVEIIKYLETPPDRETLVNILEMLDMGPRDLMRKGEKEYKENNLNDASLSRDALIDALLKYPRLIERPIVVKNSKAAIGRPLENVTNIL